MDAYATKDDVPCKADGVLPTVSAGQVCLVSGDGVPFVVSARVVSGTVRRRGRGDQRRAPGDQLTLKIHLLYFDISQMRKSRLIRGMLDGQFDCIRFVGRGLIGMGAAHFAWPR